MSAEADGDGPLPAAAAEKIERRDPAEIAREVSSRRTKRRLKAALSLLIAASAGTFLACVGKRDRNRPTPAPNPTTNETSNLPAPRRPDAAARSADGGRQARERQQGKVDRAEHRKGMPVPDNLLE